MKNGFNGELADNNVWYCSDLSETYFFDLDKNPNGCEELEEIEEGCIRTAFENAQITAAIQNFNGDKLVVFKLSINSEFCKDDYSCKNMNDIATVVSNSNIQLSDIQEVYVSEDAYQPSLKLFHLCSLIGNDQLNTDELNDKELVAIEAISESRVFIEELMYFEWEILN